MKTNKMLAGLMGLAALAVAGSGLALLNDVDGGIAGDATIREFGALAMPGKAALIMTPDGRAYMVHQLNVMKGGDSTDRTLGGNTP